MKTQKLKISNLKVQSFVTNVDKDVSDTVRGGYWVTNYSCGNKTCTAHPYICTYPTCEGPV